VKRKKHLSKAGVKSTDQQLSKIKNQIRGAISQLQTVPLGKDTNDHWKSHQKATKALNKALGKARKMLPPSGQEELERWVDTFNGYPKAKRIGTDFSLLGLLPREISSDNLQTALGLSLKALQRSNESLQRFLHQAACIANDVANQDWLSAENKLDLVVREHGQSYWAVETKIEPVRNSV
jgi:hypothetical protein